MKKFAAKYIPLTPQDCLKMDFEPSMSLVKDIIGADEFEKACKNETVSPLKALKGQNDINLARTAKIVGINPRLTKTLWGIVKYALSFPENAIHIMPLWETGDGSLYVQNSWNLNEEFLDEDLKTLGFDTASKQLKFIVNILHALGKIVGFDALEHVDNFAQIVILNPSFFEWVKLTPDRLAQDFSVTTEEIAENIKQLIIKELNLPQNLYEMQEAERQRLVFPADVNEFSRRMQLRKLIRDNLYEPIPVVEHAPVRPIVYEKTECSQNESWAVFTVKDKASAAKVMGSITPYKFYKIQDGYPVKNCFDEAVVEYFAEKIYSFQKEYDFDFFRADMAHNQTSHSHNEAKDMHCVEFWAKVKDKITKEKPYFATFAESFWGNYYISGVQDMINKKFDIVLGELNFKYLNEEFTDLVNKFVNDYRRLYNLFPSLTVFTNDGDLPMHDDLYRSQEANDCRYFISMFMQLPSYMGMGFETRNLSPNSQRMYSNLYAKKQAEEFQFGTNLRQFETISKLRTLYSEYKPIIENNNFFNVNTGNRKQLCWYYETEQNKKIVFCVNLDSEITTLNTTLSKISNARLIYTNSQYDEIFCNLDTDLKIENLYIGECVVYETS